MVAEEGVDLGQAGTSHQGMDQTADLLLLLGCENRHARETPGEGGGGGVAGSGQGRKKRRNATTALEPLLELALRRLGESASKQILVTENWQLAKGKKSTETVSNMKYVTIPVIDNKPHEALYGQRTGTPAAVSVIKGIDYSQLKPEQRPQNVTQVSNDKKQKDICLHEGLQNGAIIDVTDRHGTERQEGREKVNSKGHFLSLRVAVDANIRQKIPIVVQGGIAEVKIGGAKAKLLKGQLEKIGTRLGNCVYQYRGSQEGGGKLATARMKRQRFPKVKTITETDGGTMKKERSLLDKLKSGGNRKAISTEKFQPVVDQTIECFPRVEIATNDSGVAIKTERAIGMRRVFTKRKDPRLQQQPKI